MLALYKKELKSYFFSMTGFVFVFILLAAFGVFVTVYNLVVSYASLAYAVGSVQIILMFTVPILTSRILASEKRARTDRLLYSLPVSSLAVVLAKYLAMLTVFATALAPVAVYPIVLSVFGSVPLFPSYAALVGFFLLGAALIALSTFLSALTESQVVAAVASLGVVLGLYLFPTLATMIPSGAVASLVAFLLLALLVGGVLHLVSRSLLVPVVTGGALALSATVVYLVDPKLLRGAFPTLLERLALFERFDVFVSGIFDVTALVYFLSFSVFFLYLTVATFEKKRYA